MLLGGNVSRLVNQIQGLPWWLSGKESTCQCRRHRFNPWVRKIPWRRKWQHTPVFLPGKSHGRESLVGYTPWGRKRVRPDRVSKQQQQTRSKSGKASGTYSLQNTLFILIIMVPKVTVSVVPVCIALGSLAAKASQNVMVLFFPKQFQHRLKLVGHYPFTKHSCLVNYNFEADTSRNLIVPISCSFQSKCLVSRISDISTMYCKTVSPPSTGTLLLFSLCLHHPFGVLGKGVMPDKIPQLFLWHGHLTYIAQGKDCFILLTS